MPQIPNATAERIGVGGIVKLSSPCTVIIEKVGTGNIATVDGRSVYEFTEVGDYIFESTCECTGFYAITERGVLTGCCPVFSAPDPDTGLVTVIDENDTLLVTIPTKSTVSQQTDGGFIATNPDGSVIGPWYTDTVVTYTWTETNPVDGDGIVEWTATPSDGSALQVITITEPTVNTDTIFTSQSIVEGVLVQEFTDVNGGALPSIETDVSVLISSPLIAGDGIVITTDAVTGERTISSSVVDTDTFAMVNGSTVTDASGNSVTVPAGSTYNAVTNQITTSDGQVVDLMVDTDTDTFATQNAAGDLVLSDGTVVPLTGENTTYTLSQNVNGATVLTDSDGVAQTISNTDTDVSDVSLVWDAATNSFVSTVTEDGVDVVGVLHVADGVRECGDKAMILDPTTSTLQLKPLDPGFISKSGNTSPPAGTQITTDTSVTAAYVSGYQDGPEDFTTIANPNCFDVNLYATPQLTGIRSALYMPDGSTTTLHSLRYSTDGFLSNTLALTNKAITHAHSNTGRPLANQLTHSDWSGRRRLVATIPANSSISLGVRVAHSVVTQNTSATVASVQTFGSMDYYIEKA